jgi:hypothetical protein
LVVVESQVNIIWEICRVCLCVSYGCDVGEGKVVRFVAGWSKLFDATICNPLCYGVRIIGLGGSVICLGGFICSWLGDCIFMSCRKSINVTSSVRSL